MRAGYVLVVSLLPTAVHFGTIREIADCFTGSRKLHGFIPAPIGEIPWV